MKKILAIAILLTAFSCMDNDDPAKDSLTVHREKAIAAAIGTKDLNRIYVVTRILMGAEYDPAAPALEETVALNKTTGRKSLIYIALGEERVSSAGFMAPCGSIKPGWELRNDGCWYHGKLFTACDGQTLFVADPNPYIDNYIGNEPKCMSQEEFDTVV